MKIYVKSDNNSEITTQNSEEKHHDFSKRWDEKFGHPANRRFTAEEFKERLKEMSEFE